MSTQDATLGLDQSDQSSAIVVNVPAIAERAERQPQRRPGRSRALRRAPTRVELDVDQHQDAQDAPEQGVGRAEAPDAPQPERLVGVQAAR